MFDFLFCIDLSVLSDDDGDGLVDEDCAEPYQGMTTINYLSSPLQIFYKAKEKNISHSNIDCRPTLLCNAML